MPGDFFCINLACLIDLSAIMKIAFDKYNKDDLYPFTLNRDVQDIRVGILTIAEKWNLLLKHFPAIISGKEINNEDPETYIVPKNYIPSLNLLSGLKNTKKINISDRELNHPWQIFQYNDRSIKEDFELITQNRKSEKISSTNSLIGDQLFIEKGAVVEHCYLNSVAGPIYIGKNAEVMEGCMIRGSVAICEGSKIKMGSKIYGATTIGPYSLAGGEIKNSVLFGYSNKAHDGYLGDSVIGEWCNLGAGTSTSNIKNTASEVFIWNEPKKEKVNAGFKCGLLMGDYSRAAINTSFNTGTVTGICCNIFKKDFPPTFIPSFSWGDKKYELEKALDHINNWKKLKGKFITEEEKKLISNIYNQINDNA